MKSTIKFLGLEYPSRTIDTEDFGLVTISTTELLDAIELQEGGVYADFAEETDNEIFFYVSNEEIELSDEELEKLLIENIL